MSNPDLMLFSDLGIMQLSWKKAYSHSFALEITENSPALHFTKLISGTHDIIFYQALANEPCTADSWPMLLKFECEAPFRIWKIDSYTI